MTAPIRVRAGLAVVQHDSLLLIPHYATDGGAVQWSIPGGRVEFGEGVEAAALREFEEETGLRAQITGLLTVSEVILPERPWHSITITFSGRVIGGQVVPEAHPVYGQKIPRWFTAQTVQQVAYHPKPAVEQALGIGRNGHLQPRPAGDAGGDSAHARPGPPPRG